MFLAAAETLGALLRLECLAQHATTLKPAFAALRRCSRPQGALRALLTCETAEAEHLSWHRQVLELQVCRGTSRLLLPAAAPSVLCAACRRGLVPISVVGWMQSSKIKMVCFKDLEVRVSSMPGAAQITGEFGGPGAVGRRWRGGR